MDYIWPVVIGGLLGCIFFAIRVGIVKDAFEEKPEHAISQANHSSTASTPQNSWIKREYVDQFQNPSGQTYITTRSLIPGNNTTPLAITSQAGLELGVDSNSVWMRISQANVIIEPRIYDQNPYQVEVLTGSGKNFSFIGRPADNGLIYLENHKVFVNLLIDEQASIKIYLAHLDTFNSTSTYLFYVDPRGFENMVRRKALNA